MSGENKRRSERVIPFLSEEEVVLVHVPTAEPYLAKMLDLSDVGMLLYLLVDAGLPELGDSCRLSLYNAGRVFDVIGTIARKNGRLVAFDFVDPSPEATKEIQAKLIRMEVEWIRLSGGR